MLFLGPKLNHIFLVLLPWVFIVLQNRFLVIKISTSAGYFGLADHFCWWNPTCCCLDPYFRWATVTMLSYDSPAQKRRRTHAPVRPVVRPRWWRYPRQPGGCRMAWRAAEVLPKKKSDVLQSETVSKVWYALVIQSSSSLENVCQSDTFHHLKRSCPRWWAM